MKIQTKLLPTTPKPWPPLNMIWIESFKHSRTPFSAPGQSSARSNSSTHCCAITPCGQICSTSSLLVQITPSRLPTFQQMLSAAMRIQQSVNMVTTSLSCSTSKRVSLPLHRTLNWGSPFQYYLKSWISCPTPCWDQSEWLNAFRCCRMAHARPSGASPTTSHSHAPNKGSL